MLHATCYSFTAILQLYYAMEYAGGQESGTPGVDSRYTDIHTHTNEQTNTQECVCAYTYTQRKTERGERGKREEERNQRAHHLSMFFWIAAPYSRDITYSFTGTAR